MRFYNIITQAQTQSGSLPGGFGGKEGLEDFIDDVRWDTGAVVFHTYLDPYLPDCVIQAGIP